MTARRRPVAATFSRPIPALARLAATLALGSAACKGDRAAPDTPAPPPPPPPPTTAASPSTAPALDAAGALSDVSLDGALAVVPSDGGNCASADGGPCIRTVTVAPGTDPFGAIHGDVRAPNPAGGMVQVRYPQPGDPDFPRPAGPAFPSIEAATSLSNVAASVGSCKQPGGPTGHGHVIVSFGPQGRPARVTVSPPFAGTPEGACIAGRFDAVHVPPFAASQGNGTMGTSFDVE
jgi:hypothetical protein